MSAQMYCDIILGADEIVHTSQHYYKGCMHKRNRYMADNSSYCICYLVKSVGGTKYTVDYACKIGLNIVGIM